MRLSGSPANVEGQKGGRSVVVLIEVME